MSLRKQADAQVPAKQVSVFRLGALVSSPYADDSGRLSREKGHFPLSPNKKGTLEHTGVKYRSQQNDLVRPEESQRGCKAADKQPPEGQPPLTVCHRTPWDWKLGRRRSHQTPVYLRLSAACSLI